ncbi:MAG TPA: thioredoxin family protein [Galbitalea sp.]|jgi:thiol-disulfide isomerase/thioredoxin|nr:thioredoxin family protein [Galbitalea sp.]
MNLGAVLAILLGLVAFATVLGVAWKARTGRVRTRAGDGNAVDLPEVPLAGRATLLQFSTEVCAPCVPTRRVLGQIADTTDGVSHVDLDLTHRPDIAARFNVLQTPTTLILDRAGIIRARIGGAPRQADVRAALETILAA